MGLEEGYGALPGVRGCHRVIRFPGRIGERVARLGIDLDLGGLAERLELALHRTHAVDRNSLILAAVEPEERRLQAAELRSISNRRTVVRDHGRHLPPAHQTRAQAPVAAEAPAHAADAGGPVRLQ